MTWLANNLGTIVVGLIVLAMVFFAARSVYRSFRSGGCSSCGDACGGCACGKSDVPEACEKCHGEARP